ncbi:MAG: DMT family transporter [Burkholderiales bacterium]
MEVRRPLDAQAFSLMLVLTALWGFQQVAIKLTAPDVPLVMQAALRTALAAVLLLAWARTREIPLFSRDGTLLAGLGAGLLFGAEFVFIYAGLAHTAASRMVIFIYLAPVLTALGLHRWVSGERLARAQWLGVAVSFAGIALAFGDGFAHASGSALGDACGVVAAGLWAATTVLIRASPLTRASAAKTLFYQLGVATPVLFAASMLLGERGVIHLSALALASLAYQGVIVAFASYLAWFWLLTRYLAARLSVFSFMTPLFGVLSGVLVLGEPLTPSFAGAALLVGAGIVLVNRRPAAPRS